MAVRFGLGVFLGLFATFFMASRAVSENVVTRIDELSNSLVKFAAENGESKIIDANRGDDLFDILTKYCGSANARGYYLPFFIAANKTNKDISSKRTVLTESARLTLPGCWYAREHIVKVPVTSKGPDWKNPVVMDVSGTTMRPEKAGGPPIQIDPKKLTSIGSAPLGTSLTEVNTRRLRDPEVDRLFQKMSNEALVGDLASSVSSISKALQERLRTQDVAALNKNLNFNAIPASDSVKSTNLKPVFSSLKLKKGIDPEVITSFFDQQTNAHYQMPTPHPILAIPQSVGGKGCPTNGESATWPVNVKELKKVLLYRSALRSLTLLSPILIFDTGLPKGGETKSPFIKEYFVRNNLDESSDGTSQPYVWSIASDKYFADGFPHASHGVQVLSAALGGVDVLQDADLLKKMVTISNGAIIDWMGYDRDAPEDLSGWTSDSSALLEAMQGTQRPSTALPSVINLSLEYDLNLKSFNLSNIMNEQKQTLYVFAAGNQSREVSETNFMPATLGGAQSPNAITVAAATPEGSLWQGSNYGKYLVDIAAPGCSLLTTTWNAAANSFGLTLASGTSLSAPLVSFFASLIHSDFANKAAETKQRVLISGRYSPTLADKIQSQRILDGPNALATFFTTLRVGEQPLQLGLLEWPKINAPICGVYKSEEELWQISKAGTVLNVIQRPSSYSVSPYTCQFSSGDFSNVVFKPLKLEGGILYRGPSLKLDQVFKDNPNVSITMCSKNCQIAGTIAVDKK